MNVYVFRHVENLTSFYHSDGGLVIIAKTMGRAQQMFEDSLEDWEKEEGYNIEISDSEWSNVLIYPTTDTAEEAIFIFADAGCCG